MAGTARPYFWASRNAWYINVKGANGKTTKRKLGDSKKQAFERWKAMLRSAESGSAGSAREGSHAAGAGRKNPTFLLAVTQWLELQYKRQQRGEVSSSWLTRAACTLETFTKLHPAKLCLELTPEFIEQWIQTTKKTPGTARTDLITIKQVLRWAVQSGRLSHSPLADFRAPAVQTRTRILSFEEHCKLCRASDKNFKPILRIAWLTGCRPGELRALRWDHLSADFTRAVVAEHKTARKTKKPRVIYFPARGVKILKRLKKLGRNAEFVFCNRSRKPWTKDAVVSRMKRIRERTGLDAIAYNYRHTWITRALLSGVDIATVAVLSGHSSVEMISRIYGHLDQHQGYLLEEVGKVK